jgi:uncharacterized protein
VIPTVVRPQEPKPPFPYPAEDVSYPNPKAAGVTLAGTLTLPEGKGPFAAAILISGSGPQNRDENILGHKPFLVLADYLTRQGFAVLRVDDRGVGKSTGAFAEATSRDFASDVEAGIAFLKSRPEIAAHKIGLIGHSEGALVATILAAQHQAAFAVLLAGPAVTGEEIVIEQGDRIAHAEGIPDTAITRQHKLQAELMHTVSSATDSAVAAQKIRELIQSSTPAAEQDQSALLDAKIRQLLSPWFRFFLTYNPQPDLKKITVPVLAIYGEKDLQVPPEQNAAPMTAALQHPAQEVKVLPHLNHLLQHATTGSPAEYAKIEETLAPEALETISTWLKQQTAK